MCSFFIFGEGFFTLGCPLDHLLLPQGSKDEENLIAHPGKGSEKEGELSSKLLHFLH